MREYRSLTKAELEELNGELNEKYNHIKSQNLSLDMSRGKPCPEQLDLSAEMLNILQTNAHAFTEAGVDTRNYGGLEGIPEARELFAQMLGVNQADVIVGGNSSLNIMYNIVANAMLFGMAGSEHPWCKLPQVKFLCPSPGYDRHFTVCESLGIEMITVDMDADGPDMDTVERLVKADESIKGMWCVPKYSNPTGITYADQVVDRLAKMETKADDFKILWDNAYTVHHLTDTPDELKNILEACREAGNPDRVFVFASTSKITYAGAGVSVLATSANNISWYKKHLAVQTIGPDKINQLRHVRFLQDMDNLHAHMQKQAAIIKPKFDMVTSMLDSELGGLQIADWSKPNGGYFISLDTLDGCAQKVVSMAAAAGVKLTGAGATYPYGKDPRDRNIRLAPTFPSLSELKQAIEVVCLCVKIASVEKYLAEK